MTVYFNNFEAENQRAGIFQQNEIQLVLKRAYYC